MKKKYILIILLTIFAFGGFMFIRRRRIKQVTEIIPPAAGFCGVKSLKEIGKGAFPKFSPDGKLIAFNKKAGEIYEIFTMEPDGSKIVCLTCGKAALLNTGHKGQPYWHPSGEYLTFTAENTLLPKLRLGLNAYPDCGRNHNVWIMTADGEKFWRMTDYENNWGVIVPKFSHDGQTLYWNEEYSMEKHPGVGGQWSVRLSPKGEELGLFRIKTAAISFEENSPHLTNIETININQIHPNLRLIEGEGFMPDDQGFVFSADNLSETKGRMFWGEIYTSDLSGGLLKRLTHTPFKHDENAEFSPDGRKIVWSIATKGAPGEGIDLFMMDPDGSNNVRLTHFNEQGYPEYIKEKHRCEEITWNPDGKSLIFALGIGEDISQEENRLYLLTFEGVCGKQ